METAQGRLLVQKGMGSVALNVVYVQTDFWMFSLVIAARTTRLYGGNCLFHLKKQQVHAFRSEMQAKQIENCGLTCMKSHCPTPTSPPAQTSTNKNFNQKTFPIVCFVGQPWENSKWLT